MNFIKIEVYNLDETKVYKNDLWLLVLGKKKSSLSAKEVYELYKTRFNIEHFLNLKNLNFVRINFILSIQTKKKIFYSKLRTLLSKKLIPNGIQRKMLIMQ